MLKESHSQLLALINNYYKECESINRSTNADFDVLKKSQLTLHTTFEEQIQNINKIRTDLDSQHFVRAIIELSEVEHKPDPQYIQVS